MNFHRSDALSVFLNAPLATVALPTLIYLFSFTGQIRAAELRARIVDAYGRPLAAANMEVMLKEKDAGGKITNVYWLKLSSDQNGQIKGTYDEKRVSGEGELWIYVSKDGYSDYNTSLRPERGGKYVMRRVFGSRDFRRITRLKGQTQQIELRDLLAGDYEAQAGEWLDELVFLSYGELRDALRALILDPKVGTRAIQLLSLVGVPEDMALLAAANKNVESPPPAISSTNLVEAGQALAKALDSRHWERNREPRFNDESDMALVDLEFVDGRCRTSHTATFHLVDGIWKLRGVRETSQALMAFPPDHQSFVGIWHGYATADSPFGRLHLKADGTGLFVISERPDSSPDTYRVKRWEQRRFELDLIVEPTNPDSELLTLENVHYGLGSLEFDLCGKGWKRKMKLFGETEFERRASAVKRTMETISTPVGPQQQQAATSSASFREAYSTDAGGGDDANVLDFIVGEIRAYGGEVRTTNFPPINPGRWRYERGRARTAVKLPPGTAAKVKEFLASTLDGSSKSGTYWSSRGPVAIDCVVRSDAVGILISGPQAIQGLQNDLRN